MTRLKSAYDYAKMPSLDGAVSCSGRLFPADGRAWLTLIDHSTKASWTWTFRVHGATAKRWRQLGVSPVVWQFAPPRNHPFQNYGDNPYRATALTIVVIRDVLITTQKNGSFTWFRVEKPSRGAPTARTNPGAALNRYLFPRTDLAYVDLTPEVKIIQVQDPALMPQFDRPDSIMGAVGAPFLLVSEANDAQPLQEQDFTATGEVSESALMKLGLQRWPKMPTSFETAPPGNLSTNGRRMDDRSCPNHAVILLEAARRKVSASREPPRGAKRLWRRSASAAAECSAQPTSCVS